MPAPAQYSYSGDALVAAHTALLGVIDEGAAAAKIRIFSEADALLAEITLTDPAGTVNATTGQLTLTQASAGTGLADATATWGVITNSDNAVKCTLPVAQGASAVSGQIVISNTDIVTSAEVTLVAATIG